MANIRPFCAVRPEQSMVEKIAALPYDVYNRKEAREEVKRNPQTFLKVDRPETLLSEDVDIYSQEVYEKAACTLHEMMDNNEFVQDPVPNYYIYELTMNGRVQTGIVGCAAIDDYLNDIIMKHENTRSDKEEDRTNHIDVCDAQTGPIFLTYRANDIINIVVSENKKEEPLYDFVAEDGISHRVWKLQKEEDIEKIRTAFEGIHQIYIADGHHRAASAVKVGLKRRAKNPEYTGQEEFNYFLSVLFPSDELYVMDYNRVVLDLNGNTVDEFKEKLEKDFEIEKYGNDPYAPKEKGTFGMFLEGEWYCLKAKDMTETDPVKSLDVSILQEKVLRPILGIEDPKTNQRIKFVGGIRGLKELEKDSENGVAFSMYPTAIEELLAVSDAGMLMPPKSTWFEPKLRSGLFIHQI